MRGRYSYRQEYGFTPDDYAEYKRIRERMCYKDHGAEVIRLKKLYASGVVHIKRFFQKGSSTAATTQIMLEVLDKIYYVRSVRYNIRSRVRPGRQLCFTW